MILGFSGKKKSGKSTCCNFISGCYLQYLNLVTNFEINEKGQLVTDTLLSNGEVVRAPIDVCRRNSQWLKENLWPYCKTYAIADQLKQIATDLFGIPYEQVYGTDEQKNQPTHLKWSDFKYVLDKKLVSKIEKEPENRITDGYLTGRGFLQIFGTDVCRRIFGDCWINGTLSRIREENSNFALICDVRFPNEVEAIQKAGGKVVRLLRAVAEDQHESETALDKYDAFDYVLDNSEMSVPELLNRLYSLIAIDMDFPFKVE